MQKIDKESEKNFLEADNFRINGDFTKAIEIFKRLLIRYPKLPPALNNLAMCYAGLNQLDEAEKYYLKCLETEPVSILSINNLAKLYFKSNQYHKALPYLKKSLSRKEDQLDVVEVIATCMFELKFTKETDNFCREAIKKFPESEVLKNYYGKNLLRLNKHSEGQKYLNESTGVIEFGEENFNIEKK